MQRTQKICLVILASIAVGFSLFYLKSVLLPFVLAVFIMIGCRPILEYLERRLNLNRYVAFAVAFSVGTAMLVGFAFLVWLSVNDLSQHSDSYQTRIDAIAQWAGERLKEPTAEPKQTDIESETETADRIGKSLDAAADDARQAIQELLNSASEFLQQQTLLIASSLSAMLSYGFLVLIFVFFLLLGPDERRSNQPKIVRKIEMQVRRYLVLKTAISLVTGLAIGFILWMFGVPLAIMFGFLAFILNFIPNIGPLISTLLPAPFLILNDEMSILAAATCFVLVAAIQFISGNLIETRIMGKSFDVSPVVLLLGLMFFGLVWGIIGMFLATPIASIAKIIFQQHESTQPISELMAGRWVSSDVSGDV